MTDVGSERDGNRTVAERLSLDRGCGERRQERALPRYTAPLFPMLRVLPRSAYASLSPLRGVRGEDRKENRNGTKVKGWHS